MKNGTVDVSAYNGYFDIQYSLVSASCKLDIFLPDQHNGPVPVIVSIHGGAFKKCDKRDLEMIEPMLKGLDCGYAVVGVNYRLSYEAQFPEPVKDIKQALRFIIEHADVYGFDSERIVVWGGSAGGYFALMSGLIQEISYFDDRYSSAIVPNICGVIAWFPPVSFGLMDSQLRELGLLQKDPDHNAADSPESLFLGEPVLESTTKLIQSNPITYINEAMPRMLIQHGFADRIVPYKQSEQFAEEAQKICNDRDRVTYQIIEEAGHGDQKFSDFANLEIVYSFIDHCFKY